ncbi:hypothetical protein DRQ36_04470 [bacterium]|nr:MAG: hypothetical protein DRQ36_04470 [bacterium]
MKKALLLVGVAALLLSALPLLAADLDEMHITVTVEYIDITLRTADDGGDYGTWAIPGVVATGSQHTMTTGSGGDHILVKNNSSVALDFSAYSSDAGGWTAGAAAGNEVYLLEGGKGDVDNEPGTYTTLDDPDPGDQYVAAEPANTDHHLYLQLTVPTVVADGAEHDITVTVKATP